MADEHDSEGVKENSNKGELTAKQRKNKKKKEAAKKKKQEQREKVLLIDNHSQIHNIFVYKFWTNISNFCN